MDKKTHLEAQSVKILEDTEGKFYDIEFGNDFLVMTPNHKHKEKNG